MKKPLTLDDYMAARPIADPIHLFDCVMPCAGAEALPGHARGHAPRLSACPARGCSRPSSATTPFRTIRSRCAAAGRWMSTSSTAMAGVAPDDIDVVETYDDYPVIVDDAVRGSRLLREGRGAGIRPRATTSPSTATFPHNTSGGQLSVGPGGRRRRLSRPGRGDAAGDRPVAGRARSPDARIGAGLAASA